jgi:hypothetical protein
MYPYCKFDPNVSNCSRFPPLNMDAHLVTDMV